VQKIRPILRIVFLAALGSAASVHAVPVSYAVARYNYPGETQKHLLHIVAPAPEGAADSAQGRAGLLEVSKSIRAESLVEGFLHSGTAQAYDRELALLEEGRWPTFWVTLEGHPAILKTLSFAIRWDASPLPFEQTFAGRGIIGAPTEFLQTQPFVASLDRDPAWMVLEELNSDPNAAIVREALQTRPAVTNENAEIKFALRGGPQTKRHLQVLHEATLMVPLHRTSRVPLPPKMQVEYNQWIAETTPQKPADVFISAPGVSRDPKRLTQAFYAGLYLPEWEPHVLNRYLYVHVSGLHSKKRPRTARSQAFINELGFPETPQWSFEETAEVGTAGVHTDIFRVSLHVYHEPIRARMRARLAIAPEQFKLEWLPTDTPIECSGLISRAEAWMLDRIAHTEADL
jgi:hypothetical protein